jgi:hypothetical protein
MTEDQRDEQNIPESLADEPTRRKLAKARERTRANLVRKLKVSMETVRRSEKRADLCLSILRQYVERKGGRLCLKVEFPGQPPVVLAALGLGGGSKGAEKTPESGAKSKAKRGGAA